MIELHEDAAEMQSDRRPAAGGWFGLKDVFRDTASKPYRLIYEAAPDYALLVSARLHGSLVVDGLPQPLAPHAVRLVLPGQRVESVFDAADEQLLFRLHFELLTPAGGGSPADPQPIERALAFAAADPRVQPLCERIAAHWHTGDAADRFASQAGFQELLHLLFKRPGVSEDALERAFAYMREHFREAVTVESLAEKADMSRYHFMRSFKERFGQSSIDLLTELRTNEAKRLLEAGLPLRDVADAVGYKDPLYFSSQFKKQVGVPPRIYIANRKCRTAAYSWPNIGHLLALQIVPYAAPIDQHWTDDYRRKYRFDVKVPLSHDYDFNLTALQRARPDRIVALDEMLPEEEKARLRRVAPVLFLKWHQESWRVHLRQTASFLEREKDGERWLERYESRAAEVRAYVPESMRLGRLLILDISPRGIQVWGRRAGTVLYDDLGFRCAGGLEAIAFTAFMEAERLAAFEADVLMVSVMRDKQSQAEWERLQSSACWKRLKAVREGNLMLTSGHTWLREPILEYTPHRHELMLQELELLFRAAPGDKVRIISHSHRSESSL